MASPKIQIAPELVAEGRRLYETTMTTIADIAGLMGLKRRTLENRIVEWNWKRRRQPNGALDIFHAVRGAAIATATAEAAAPNAAAIGPVTEQRRAAIADRIMGVVEREMTVVERVVSLLGPSDMAEAESTARTLTAITRALHEIKAINQPDEVTPPDETNDDPIPRDIDEIREELARRIHALIDAETGTEGAGDSSGSAGVE